MIDKHYLQHFGKRPLIWYEFYLTESIHGAGSPQAQKIMIARLADLESAKSCAFQLCGI